MWCSFLLQGPNFALALREVLSSAGPGAGLSLGVSLPTQGIVILHPNYTGLHDTEQQNPRGQTLEVLE